MQGSDGICSIWKFPGFDATIQASSAVIAPAVGYFFLVPADSFIGSFENIAVIPNYTTVVAISQSAPGHRLSPNRVYFSRPDGVNSFSLMLEETARGGEPNNGRYGILPNI